MGSPPGLLQARSLGEAGLEALLAALVAAGHLGGTVNLPNGGRAKTGSYPLALRGDAQFGDLAPGDHRLGTKRAIVG